MYVDPWRRRLLLWGAASMLSACALPPALSAPEPNPASIHSQQPGQANGRAILPTPTPKPGKADGLTPAQRTLLATLPNFGPAPELSNKVWFNSAPLKLADLRGKVVMIEFWTFG